MINHFKNLYSNIPIKSDSEQNQITENLNKLELAIKDSQNPLITEKQVEEKLNNLKPKKSSGIDGILNEMLKHSSRKIRLAILKLFNLIMSVGSFPDVWNRGLVTPIFKNGNKSDPDNYRGICVNSNLGKVFCSIINSILIDLHMKDNILSKSQIGFIPNQFNVHKQHVQHQDWTQANRFYFSGAGSETRLLSITCTV